MIIRYSSRFKKQYKKLSFKIQSRVDGKLHILIKNEYDFILNNHKLHGTLAEYRSIDILSNLRIVYRKEDEDTFYLYAIGSHSELYS